MAVCTWTTEVDGVAQVHSLEHWPLLENPWMRQIAGGDILDIRNGSARRTSIFRSGRSARRTTTRSH